MFFDVDCGETYALGQISVREHGKGNLVGAGAFRPLGAREKRFRGSQPIGQMVGDEDDAIDVESIRDVFREIQVVRLHQPERQMHIGLEPFLTRHSSPISMENRIRSSK